MEKVLRCGAVAVDITPMGFVPGIRLAGFGFDRRATKVLDSLEAVAIHLSDGEAAVTFIAMDLIGYMYPYVDRLRARLRGRGGHVLPCATHNHAGPDTIGLWGRSLAGRFPLTSGVVPEYMESLQASLVRAVIAACEKAEPVVVRAARFEVPPHWFRNDRKGGGKDDFGYVLQFVREDKTAVATIVNFAAHPETLWEHNTFVSSDYPGAVRARIRERFGGIAAFFSGALGGMVTPNVPLEMDVEGRIVEAKRLGTGLADLASDAIDKAGVFGGVPLSVRCLPIELRLSNWRFRLARMLGIMDRELVLGRVRSEMNLVRIGEEVSVLTAPGECTPEVGHALASVVPGKFRLLFCLGCDEIGYVLTPEQFSNREYRYEQSMSLGPSTGPDLLQAARELVQMT